MRNTIENRIFLHASVQSRVKSEWLNEGEEQKEKNNDRMWLILRQITSKQYFLTVEIHKIFRESPKSPRVLPDIEVPCFGKTSLSPYTQTWLVFNLKYESTAMSRSRIVAVLVRAPDITRWIIRTWNLTRCTDIDVETDVEWKANGAYIKTFKVPHGANRFTNEKCRLPSTIFPGPANFPGYQHHENCCIEINDKNFILIIFTTGED